MLALDAGSLERPVQESSGGPDERQALLVLLVARLLADQHHARMRVARAEHGLRGIGPQRAVLALASLPPELIEIIHRPLESPT